MISPSDLEALSLISDAVPVQRVGISDTTRRMTLSYLWAHQSDGHAVLVRCVDAAEPRITLDSATLTEDQLSDLIVVLSAKGVLDEQDVAHLRRLRHSARHVATIDGWPLTP
jgi:hypothetical protein